MLDVARLKADMLTARKERDKVAEMALKAAIGRVESAEAPPAPRGFGGPTEVARLELTEADIRACMQDEIDEALAAVAIYEAGGRTEEAARLLAQADVLASYLA